MTSLLTLVGLSLLASPAIAQDARDESDAMEVQGLVLDGATGEAVAGVIVLFSSSAVTGESPSPTTDADGRFTALVPGEGLYEATFMRLGYRTTSDTVRVTERGEADLVATMVPQALGLDPLAVTVEQPEVQRGGMDGFRRRMESFPGDFLTRSDIDRINPEDISQLLVQVGSFRSVPGRRGERRRVLGRGGCPPTYIVDGTPLVRSPVDVLDPDALEAVEVYRGSHAPAEFQVPPTTAGGSQHGLPEGACGTVVFWTQDGQRGTAEPDPMGEEGSGRSWIPVTWVAASITGIYFILGPR